MADQGPGQTEPPRRTPSSGSRLAILAAAGVVVASGFGALAMTTGGSGSEPPRSEPRVVTSEVEITGTPAAPSTATKTQTRTDTETRTNTRTDTRTNTETQVNTQTKTDTNVVTKTVTLPPKTVTETTTTTSYPPAPSPEGGATGG